MITLTDLATRVIALPRTGNRRLVAVAGAPASGKSTLADALADSIRAQGPVCAVVPMDGFHLDNSILAQRGLLDRKGAPETFDAAGFTHLVHRLKAEDDVIFPSFDRARDLSVAGSGVVDAACQTVIVEGNYLLLDHPSWGPLANLWDMSVWLDVPMDTLESRLIRRWLDNGLDPEAARTRAASNDLPNAALVAAHVLPADITVTSQIL